VRREREREREKERERKLETFAFSKENVFFKSATSISSQGNESM
jgi:hypothetical protein